MNCERTYVRRFAAAYPGGVEKFAAELGKSDKLLEMFGEWRQKLVNYIKENDNNRSARMAWAVLDAPLTVLETSERAQAIVEQPEDLVLAEGDYIARYVDPDWDGKGHVRVSIEGCPKGVLIPG